MLTKLARYGRSIFVLHDMQPDYKAVLSDLGSFAMLMWKLTRCGSVQASLARARVLRVCSGDWAPGKLLKNRTQLQEKGQPSS